MMLMLTLASLAVVRCAGLWSYQIEQFPPDSERQLHQALASDQRMNPYSGFGVHYLRMYLGNPAQLRTLAVSPSSDFTAFPCEDCVDCGPRGSNLYNSSESSGFLLISCGECSKGASCFNNRCAVGRSSRDLSSWSGYEVSDFAFHGGGDDPSTVIGSDSAKMFGFPMRFACQTRTRGFFNNVLDGIIGLSPAPMSFLSQMHSAGKLEHPRFSLCFNDIEFSGNTTGVVTFGGYEHALLQTEMVYAKQLGRNMYKVNIKKIHLRVGGGRSVRSSKEHVIISFNPPSGVDTSVVVDASTPFLTFDKRFEGPFRAAWRDATGRDYTDNRVDLTPQQLASMPTLLIELEVSANIALAFVLKHSRGRRLVQRNAWAHRLIRTGLIPHRLCRIQTLRGAWKDGGARTADGRSSIQENAELGMPTSVHMSGRSSALSPAPAPSAAGTDDVFVARVGSSEPGGAPKANSSGGGGGGGGGGGCYNATCRSFMAVGYVVIGTALAVAYRLSRPKERAINAGSLPSEGQRPIYHDDLRSAYRRKSTWSDADGPLLV
ncbi:Xylanase inhibitor N-terminal [Fragilaria crotonensis]|nr:Xylanase inhibitor N-terminal [Fragilaria crotonensis]